MDPFDYEEDVLSILYGRRGYYDCYDEISEFKQDLQEEGAGLTHEQLRNGWVLYETEQQYSYYTAQLQDKIIKLLRHMASQGPSMIYYFEGMMQFWGVEQVEGQHPHLSTSHYPFFVGKLTEGLCWYRKLCRDHVYVVDLEADEEHLGSVARVYRNKHPQSSPDLRLFSTNEYPMRDEAARCHLRAYLALPLFDSHTNHCYGVLEIVSLSYSIILRKDVVSALDEGLKIAELTSTHNFTTKSYKPREPEREIREIVELGMKRVPQVYLAQVWVPSQQCRCDNICMEFLYHVSSEYISGYIREFSEASRYHKLQIDIRRCHLNLCDLTISKNPLAHYAQQCRMSHSFAVSLESVDNSSDLYVIQFFIEPINRKDHSRQLLLGIMAKKLKSFKFVDDSQKTNAIGWGLNEKNFPNLKKFTDHLEIVSDSCCRRPGAIYKGWVFRSPAEERLCQNHVKINKKVEKFVKSLRLKRGYWIVQFWKAKMEKDRCYLQTSDQPFAVGCLAEDLASFRKKSMRHQYFVDEQAKEDELPPPARVFRNRHHEICHLFPYTANEFSITNYAMDCGSKGGYVALPIFEFDDELNDECVGVLEFLGFHYNKLEHIKYLLKEAELRWICTDISSIFSPKQQPDNTTYGREEALIKALQLCRGIPQFHMANVWVPNRKCDSCTHTNISCMQCTLSSRYAFCDIDDDKVDWIHVQTGKETLLGMVLASENKSCFCHHKVSNRREDYFAICLQSSDDDEGDLVYVVEFFLYPGPPTYQYIRSFLNFLLPIIQHELESFKLACGKQLGQELVVEVIEFSDATKLDSPESEQADVFPIKFKSVQHSQHSKEQHTEERNVAASDSKSKEKGKRKIEEPTIIASDSKRKEKGKQKREAASDSMTRDKGETKTGLSLTYEVLKPHFGKNLEHVGEELGCKRSTIKRACRKYGIKRWPNKKEHIKNLSLFERGSGGESTNTESNRPPIVEKETEKVIIKVKYKEDTIKFELCLSLGVSKLFEQVATRLKLNLDAFKVKYKDEDGDEILLACDADLHLCPKSQTAEGKTCMKFFVQLISK